MVGYSYNPVITDEWGEDPVAPSSRKRLIQTVMAGMENPDGTGMPRSSDSPRQTDRIEDDKTRHPQGEGQVRPGQETDLTPWTPQQRGQDRLAVMMDQYQHLGDTPQQQPMTLKQKILRGLALGAPTALGAAFGGGAGALAGAAGTLQGYQQGRQRRQTQENFETAQRSQERGRLLNAIEAENRTQEQEQAANQRMTLAQQMENQREKERQASQERLFGQQNQLEQTREAARDKTLQQQIDEQNRRQSAQFGEQEKLEGMREASADRRQAASEAARDKKEDQRWQGVASKRYETAMDAEQRLSRMEASYKEATTKGDQQAMLALLTDHIGMTLGMQKGARITKDILNEATQSQPWLAKIGAKFDERGYLSGVTLGKDQMRQMLQLGYGARDRAVQGAYDESKLYGVAPPKGADEVFGKRRVGDMPAIQGGGGQQGQPVYQNGQIIGYTTDGKTMTPAAR